MNDRPASPDWVLPSDVLNDLQAIAEPSRARVMAFLGQGERCVCDLGSALGLSPALASHHLRVLRSSGLIRERRVGRWVYYSLDHDRVERLRYWIDRLLTPSSAGATLAPSECGVDSAPDLRRRDRLTGAIAHPEMATAATEFR
jgi:ArsR family transcriptional regulator, arsenate/arsenite/antimonite-responsive transcriptional repressor